MCTRDGRMESCTTIDPPSRATRSAWRLWRSSRKPPLCRRTRSSWLHHDRSYQRARGQHTCNLRAVWKEYSSGEVATSHCLETSGARVLDTSLLTMSPTTMPFTPPRGLRRYFIRPRYDLWRKRTKGQKQSELTQSANCRTREGLKYSAAVSDDSHRRLGIRLDRIGQRFWSFRGICRTFESAQSSRCDFSTLEGLPASGQLSELNLSEARKTRRSTSSPCSLRRPLLEASSAMSATASISHGQPFLQTSLRHQTPFVLSGRTTSVATRRRASTPVSPSKRKKRSAERCASLPCVALAKSGGTDRITTALFSSSTCRFTLSRLARPSCERQRWE